MRRFAPPVRMTVAQWAESRRYLSSLSAKPGRFSLTLTPWLRKPLEALTDRKVAKVLMQKSAQIGWTDGVVANYLGYTIDVDPATTIVMFPRDKTGKDFNSEKFEPMVEATPALQSKIVLKSRDRSNRQDTKAFPGGFIKFVGSNSTGGVKSTNAKRLIVEEPDDCNVNLKGQGDSIALLEERGKTYQDKKLLVGGTPTIEGLSAIALAMESSDKQYWHVPCHECGHAAPLDWDNVTWLHDQARSHPVYGTALPETARYRCPGCGVLWNDAERIRNARRGTWVASAEFRGTSGYYINELVSGFPQSTMPKLVEKLLQAEADARAGDIGGLINFANSTLGKPWAYKSDIPDEDALEARAEDYAELSVPAGGLVLTVGVDVQHDRLAVVIAAWGRGEECWIMYWGELYGRAIDKADPVWTELDALTLDRTFRHASGGEMGVAAMSVDSGDGNTADAVYHYVRARRRRGAMATKGSSTDSAEIFRKPAERSIDITSEQKAAKYGLKPYMVGQSRAKDLLLGAEGGGRLQLRGSGPGRLHWYKGIRPDFFKQLTAEVKAPARNAPRGKKVWQRKAGVRNEALDCTVLALHAARSQRTDIKSEAQWLAIERQLTQATLFDQAARDNPASESADVAPAQSPEAGARSPASAPALPPQPQTSARSRLGRRV
jgi:phage terminase large subunit GpA-like protein